MTQLTRTSTTPAATIAVTRTARDARPSRPMGSGVAPPPLYGTASKPSDCGERTPSEGPTPMDAIAENTDWSTVSSYPPIAEYAFLSDCEVTALVAPGGNIEWMCLPR